MKNNKLFLPISIIVAAVLISGTLLYTVGGGHGAGQANVSASVKENVADNIRPVDKNDYVRGSTDPQVVVVEYSDLECPYCKHFQTTMQQLIQEYGDKVAWVYRQFPIQQLHSQAPYEALASECVGKLGGNDAFWKFIDKVYEVTPSNDGLDLSLLPGFAKDAGVSEDDFNACMETGDLAAKINEDLADAQKLANWSQQYMGSNIGTPFSVVVAGNRSTVIPGALPYAQVKAIIDDLLK